MVGDLGTQLCCYSQFVAFFLTQSINILNIIGNIIADDEGVANVSIEDRLVKLIGPHSVIGRSIIITSNEDDLGRGGNELSLSTGNAGQRVAGGVIGISSS